jgi:plastocyanin
MKRRDFLRTAGGVAGTAAVAASASGTGGAVRSGANPAVVTQDGGTVTVEVGPDNDLVYTPGTAELLAITPGTEVEFVWESNFHNIVVESQPDGANWQGEGEPGTTFDSGHTYTHTFQTEGTYEYYCSPHRTAGMEATIVVTTDPGAVTPAPTTTPAGTATPAGTTTATGDGSASGGSVEVAVGPGGNFVYDPASLTIPPGTTVNFVWESDTHNIIVENQPEGADWQGEGDTNTTYDTGHTYSHTFETTGTYDYYCSPHRTAGMVASLTVEEGATLPGQGGEGGEGGEVDPEEMGVPFQAHWVGIATLLGIGLTLLLTFFFLKYGETPHSGYPEER